MDQLSDSVMREVADQEIRFIRLWFTDVAGVLKSLAIDPGELEDALSEG
ncbi:MAG: glutamine synthetase, partial [Actinomyces sp.]|nr:glutamine synthetase [Actinomyces sp.]